MSDSASWCAVGVVTSEQLHSAPVDLVRPKPCPIASTHVAALADRLRYYLVDPWVLITSLSTCIAVGQCITKHHKHFLVVGVFWCVMGLCASTPRCTTLSLGLCLRQASNFWHPITGLRALYCTCGLSLFISPFPCLSHSSIVVLFYLLYDWFQCDLLTACAPCSLYHATLPTIANTTLIGIFP